MNDIDDMRNRQGLINDWESGLEQDLREFLDEQNKVFFDGKGEIVDGSKLQRYCNRTFGRHQSPVSEYGIALVLNNRSIGTPRVVLGVSIKGAIHPSPFTFYRLIYRLQINDWHEETFDADKSNFNDAVGGLLFQEIEILGEAYKNGDLGYMK